MVVIRKEEAKLSGIEETEKQTLSNVAYSDPQMIEISMHEIKSFLVSENIAKVILVIGSLFFGSVLSLVLSSTYIHPIVIVFSVLTFVVGLVLDVYLVYAKFKDLGQKGATRWQ